MMTDPNPLHQKTQILNGIDEIADRFDCFIIDLWGAIHDGSRPFPGVVDCLTQLKKSGKKIALLSNSPRRIHTTADHLAGMGIGDNLYDALFTSGEETHLHLRDRPDEFYQSLGHSCYFIGGSYNRPLFENLAYRLVDDVAAADFILLGGLAPGMVTFEDYLPMLEEGLRRGLPLICANPDLGVMHDGYYLLCPGLMAAFYEEQGGKVTYHGKPHQGIYKRLLAEMNVDPAQSLAIGDALSTDILGAMRMNIPSLLLATGLHEAQLIDNHGEIGKNGLFALCQQQRIAPDFAMKSLVFS